MQYFTVAPGKYYLGDPCYVVPDDKWMDLLESCDYFNKPTGFVVIGENQYSVHAFSTAYGDGCYDGSNNFDYGVDSGLIGLVPVAVCPDPNLRLVTIIEFDVDTVVTCHYGKMDFGSVTIDTDFCDDSYYPEDDDQD